MKKSWSKRKGLFQDKGNVGVEWKKTRGKSSTGRGKKRREKTGLGERGGMSAWAQKPTQRMTKN